MSFPAYPSYQESGVEWLGPVPRHWTVNGLKRAFSIAGGSTPKSDVEDFWDGDIPWITPGDLSKLSTKFISETARMITNSGLASCAASLSPAGSIVVSTRAPIGSLAVTEINASTNQGCKTLIPKDSANAAFGFYTLSVATEQLNVRGKGSTFLEISADDLGSFVLPFPPLSEQVAIAAFLDRETAKIDALIEEQRRLIALLKEKRQAIISHAVTKGLDPHAPMKDSDIEWLGEVPAHWDIKRLKQIVPSVTVGIVVEPSKHYVETGIPALRSLNVRPGRIETANLIYISEEGHESHSKSRLNAGDIVAVRTGQPGTAAIVPPELDGCNCIDLIVIRKGECFSEQFLCWYLQAEAAVRQFAEGSGGAIQLHFNIGTAVNLIVPFPPLPEQEEVAAALTTKIAEIDGVIATADRATTLLSERRAALISAAVTGKIDVRASAKVLPFPVNRARARGLVAAEVIERSAHQPTFGRVKFQKIAFLAEGHVGISELAGSYTREAAGPLDRALIDEMESGARSIAGIVATQEGGTGTAVSYRLGQQRGAHRHELADWLGANRTAKLDKLIDDFAGLTTKQAEAVATLYGVWNDILSEGISPTDDEIVTGFLNDWHPEKREKFRASELPEWLGWMRRHGIVPTGTGPHTATGRLFV